MLKLKLQYFGHLITAVFFPGKSLGQRSLAGYSPWGHKESDTTEQLTLFSLLAKAKQNSERGKQIRITFFFPNVLKLSIDSD